MVAPVDTYVFFARVERHAALKSAFERRSGRGGAQVITASISGDAVAIVDAARLQVGGAPLGIVSETESEALDALLAGADEACPLHQVDEEAITRFLDRVQTRSQVRREDERRSQDFAQAEKLTALGTLVAGVAHEVNNPLSTVTLGFDVLKAGALKDLARLWELREKSEQGTIKAYEVEFLLNSLRANEENTLRLIEDIGTATESVTQLVSDLRIFTRSDSAERTTLFHPRDLIEQVLRLVRREFDSNTVIELDYDDHLPQLCLARNRVTQVMTNLLVNAAHATKTIERTLHQVRISARLDEQHLALSVSDTGPGIPEEALERIFDPFFTTKREGQGTGLGLSISRSIVQHMGGDLVVSSVNGEGATFVCFLPLPSESVLKASRHYKEPLPASGSHFRSSVLLIDDDPAVLRMMARLLSENHKVLIARDGQEAAELLASGSHADMIIMELDLPELDGPEFLLWLEENHPRLSTRVIVATAAQERERYQHFLSTHDLTVLHKPLHKEELQAAIADLSDEIAKGSSDSELSEPDAAS